MKQSSFLFWQQWLFYSSILFALAGPLFAFNGKGMLLLPYYHMLAQYFWQQPEFPADVEPFRDFTYGPVGATICCCYILLAFIARYPFKNKEAWARNAIIVAFGTWVFIDSWVCFKHGVYAQVYIINAFSILVKALPIIFTWSYFESESARQNNWPASKS